MAITYHLQITGARVTSQNELENVVKELDLTIKGQDGACTFELPTTVALDPADPDEFVEFDELTEAELVTWVEDHPSLVPVKAHVAYVVAKEVAKAALESKPLPWAPTEPEE